MIAGTPLIILLKIKGEQIIALEECRNGHHERVSPQSAVASQEFLRLIEAFPDAAIVWYDIRIEPYIGEISSWPTHIQHPLEVLHLSTFQGCDRMAASLGFVDFDSPFLLPGPTDRRYVTWLISPLAGVGMAKTFRVMGYESIAKSFGASLFDFGKRGAKWGLCPYSEPALLKTPIPESVAKNLRKPLSLGKLAILIRRLYGRRWLAYWTLAQLLFHRRIPLLAASRAWFHRQPPMVDEAALQSLHPPLPEIIDEPNTVDVIIPTLGRPQHALNVLLDLAAQSFPPHRVTLIEQNPDSEFSDLLQQAMDKAWPFEIRHHTVSWVGTCRARNLGLSETDADWVLFLDDDVRLETNFLIILIKVAVSYHVDAVHAAVYRTGQNVEQLISHRFPRLWPRFGTCAAIVSGGSARTLGGFDERLEGGFGEDYEYGVRLRLNGANVIYAPENLVLHLKASAGGFRHKYPHIWQDARVQPRPSPTVLYSRSKFGTDAMQDGYKLFYWLKRLSTLAIRHWVYELKVLNREWNSAQAWAQRLMHLPNEKGNEI